MEHLDDEKSVDIITADEENDVHNNEKAETDEPTVELDASVIEEPEDIFTPDITLTEENNDIKTDVTTDKKTKSLTKIITAVAIVAALGLIALFALNKGVSAKKAPKLFFGAAIANTQKEFSLFTDNAFLNTVTLITSGSNMQDMDISFKRLNIPDAEIPPFFDDFGINVNSMVNRDEERALINVKAKKADASFLSANMFVSNDQIGFQVPELYSKYLTMPTVQFAEGWNNSFFGKESPISYDFQIDNLFNKLFKTEDGEQFNYNDKVASLIQNYHAEVEFTYLGKVSKEYKGAEGQYEAIAVSIPQDKFKDLVLGLWDIYYESLSNYADVFSQYAYAEIDNARAEMENQLLNTEFNDPITINFMFNKKNQIIGMWGDINAVSDDGGLNCIYNMYFTGEAKIGDVKNINAVVTDKYDNVMEINLIADTSGTTNTKYLYNTQFTINSSDSEEDITGNVSVLYDTAAESDNFESKVQFKFSEGVNEIELDLNGTVKADQKGLTASADFSKADLMIMSDGEIVNFGANIKYNASAQTPVIDVPGDTVAVFDLNQMEALSILFEVYGKLGSIPGMSELLGM